MRKNWWIAGKIGAKAIVLLAGLLLLAGGCGGDSDDPAPPPPPAAAIMAFAGFADNTDEVSIPCLWTDAGRIDLPLPGGEDSNGGYALSPVFQAGGALYAAGFSWDADWNEAPCYWTVSGSQAARTDLPLLDRAGGQAQAVAASGGVVYAAGYTRDDSWESFLPCIWTVAGGNATRTDLPIGESGYGAALSIAVSGGTVYMAGYYDNGTTLVPCYWTRAAGGDPVRVDLPAGDGLPEGVDPEGVAATIVLSGDTIYVGGNFSDGVNTIPCYWTVAGGTIARTDLPIGGESFYGMVYSLAVSDGVVHAGGAHSDGTGGFPCVWVRPAGGEITRTDLPTGEGGRGVVTTMTVSGGIVTAGGFLSGDSGWTACRWTGVELHPLEDGTFSSAILGGGMGMAS